LEKEGKYGRKSAFTNGVAVGFGIGCFATFVAILLVAAYNSRATTQTLEEALTSFSFPVACFFTLGVLFLVAGFVWERHEKQLKL
jgi:hypothetical protein